MVLKHKIEMRKALKFFDDTRSKLYISKSNNKKTYNLCIEALLNHFANKIKKQVFSSTLIRSHLLY